MRFFACLIAFFLSVGVALAKDQKLLTATNDQDKKKDTLFLRLDAKGLPTHLLHRVGSKKAKVYTPDDLAEGVVLRRKSGNDLLILKTTMFSPSKGANIQLSYLYSGIPPSEYRSIRMQLRKKKGVWTVLHGKAQTPVKRLHFLANMATVFGFEQAVGIKDVVLLSK